MEIAISLAIVVIVILTILGIGKSAESDAKQNEEESFHRSQMRKLIKDNLAILKTNEYVLKRSSFELYHLKESTIYLYDAYNTLLTFIDFKMLPLPEIQNDHDIYVIRNLVLSQRAEVEKYFINAFKVTPEVYKMMRKNITGSNDHNKLWQTQSSIN